MKSDDADILREIQKNTEMAMTAIETLSPKAADDSLTLQLSMQSLEYSRIHDRAIEKMLMEHEEVYRGSAIKDAMLKGGIRANTLLNTSTSHLAELMIESSSRGITNVWKSLNHHGNAGSYSTELAKELMDFEEKNIQKMKKYL